MTHTKKDRGEGSAPVHPPRKPHHPEGPGIPIITPPEEVTAETADLYVVVQTLRAAHHYDHIPFRREILRSILMLHEALIVPLHMEKSTVPVLAEELWWAIHGADELGNDRAMSPVGRLFRAVDDLGVALLHQAPRTDRGMTTALEAEALVEMAAHTDE